MTAGAPWRLEAGVGNQVLLHKVIVCQDAWSRLTKASQAALVVLTENAAAPVHPATIKALTAHGLLDESGVTDAGREVVRWRPGKAVTP